MKVVFLIVNKPIYQTTAVYVYCTLPVYALLKMLSLSFHRHRLSGHTIKRPRPPGAARVLEITPVVLEYYLNRIFIEIIKEGIRTNRPPSKKIFPARPPCEVW